MLPFLTTSLRAQPERQVKFVYDTQAGQSVFYVTGYKPSDVVVFYGRYSGPICGDDKCLTFTFWVSGVGRVVYVDGMLVQSLRWFLPIAGRR